MIACDFYRVMETFNEISKDGEVGEQANLTLPQCMHTGMYTIPYLHA